MLCFTRCCLAVRDARLIQIMDFEVLSMTKLAVTLPAGVGRKRWLTLRDADGFMSMVSVWNETNSVARRRAE